VTGRNNDVEIISDSIRSKALLIALFIGTPWGKFFAFPEQVPASDFVGRACCLDTFENTGGA
jgi:hypothetical protein